MAHVILMPKAGQSMTEGRIVQWLKKEGDRVERGEPILEIETDKANLEVEALESGVLRRIFAAEGDVLPVLAPLGVIGGPDEDIDFDALKREAEEKAASAGTEGAAPPRREATPAGGGSAPSPRAEAPPPPRQPRAASTPPPPPSGAAIPGVSLAQEPESAADFEFLGPRAAPGPQAAGRKVRASPLARRIAAERGVDLGSVQGTGPGGRILRRDVERAPRAGNGAAALRLPGTLPPYPPPSPRPPATLRFEGMRGAIARALLHSKTTIPHFYTTAVADMTAALALKAAKAQQGVKLTVNDLILRAVALALRDEPRVNCRVYEDHIEYPEEINLGIAVGSEEGLVVPVVLDAGRLGLEALAAESRRVVQEAQAGKLVGAGRGTFTVSNLGMWGVDSFAAIINPPEGAILAVGALQETLVARGGGFFPRVQLKLTLSADHRAIDGLLAARFLLRVRHFLESGRLE